MFTIYIHILEVLAGRTDGTFADDIHSWGICFERKLIDKGLRELKKEGFVTTYKLGKVTIWKITEKAIEYCHTVVKKDYDTNYQEEALAMHEVRKNTPPEAPQGAIREVSEEPQDENASEMISSQSYDEDEGPCYECGVTKGHNDDCPVLMAIENPPTQIVQMEGGKVTFPLYGNLTIAEVVEAYENNVAVKVTRASLENDTVTLTFEPIPHDDSFDDPSPDSTPSQLPDSIPDDYYCDYCERLLTSRSEFEAGVCFNCQLNMYS